MNKLKQKILGAVSAVAAAFALGSLGALPDIPPLSGLVVPAYAEPAEITTWGELQTALSEGGTVTLTQDITAGNSDSHLSVPTGKTVTLDLNGHTLDRGLTSPTENGYVIKVAGNLTLTDSNTSTPGKITGGNNDGNGGGVYTGNVISFNLSGAPKITGNVKGGTKNTSTGLYTGGTVDNVCLNQSHITVVSALTNSTPIGVWIADTYKKPAKGVFVSADANYNSGKLTESDLSHFTSDTPGFEIELTDGGEGKLTQPTITYVDAANNELTCGEYTVVTPTTTYWSGTMVVTDNVTIPGTVTLDPVTDTTLILCDGKTLTIGSSSLSDYAIVVDRKGQI